MTGQGVANRMNACLHIAERPVGLDFPPFIIAEMSANHHQSLTEALAIVDAAADAGADAVKIQTYTPDTMTLDLSEGPFQVNLPETPWMGKSLYALYQQGQTPWEWHETIFQHSQKRGILAFSTPYDMTAVDFLESMPKAIAVPTYKIASFELTDIPLIRKVAATGKPLILSTGMATVLEIEEAVLAARQAGCADLILLKCTSSYPASPADSHLQTIPYLRERFQVEVGLSDHTLGIGAAVASVALGATVIEKHLTLSRGAGGLDAAFSLEPDELAMLVRETRTAKLALGHIRMEPTEAEKALKGYRRSLYVTRDIQAGEKLTLDNIRAIRPGFGLAPKYLETVLGRAAARDLCKGTPLSWEAIQNGETLGEENGSVTGELACH